MASEPTDQVDPKVGQASTLPYTGGTDVNSDLMALIRQLEVPQPKPLTRTQDIWAGLMRIGNALRGGDPSIQSGPEREYARASADAQQANQATRRGLIGEEIRRREQARRDEETARRQEQNQRDVEERQLKVQAERDRLQNHSDAMNHLLELMKDGFTLPPGEDVNGLTKERMLGLANDYFKSKGLKGQDATLMAAIGTLAAQGLQASSATIPIEGGGQVTGTSPKAEKEKATVDTAPISPATGRTLGLAGGELTPGMTEAEGMNQIGELKRKKAEQDAKDRQARLNKTGMGRGGNSVMKEIVGLGRVARAAQAAIDMQEDSKRTLGGAYGTGGIGSKTGLMIHDSLYGTKWLSDRMQYEALISNSIRGELFGEGGKNLTNTEVEILGPGAPPNMISLPESVQVDLLSKLKRDALQAIIDRKKIYGLSDDDIDGLISEGEVRSDPLPGMKIDPVVINEVTGAQKGN